MSSVSRILYSSAEVRAAIINLFREGRGERIAISAFVGDGAEAYIPRPEGVHLICSPTPGATNPDALRRLMSKKVRVEFVDSLHMKVYCAEGVGAVVTSANLSTNAMGRGGLKEAGVLLGPDELNIKRLLKQLKRRPAKPELHKLDRRHKQFFSRVGWNQRKRVIPAFSEWFQAPVRPKWKMFFYDPKASGTLSVLATQNIREEFGVKAYDWMWNAVPNVEESDWILCGLVSGGKIRKLDWLFAERLFKVPKSDPHADPENPYEVVQVHGPKHYPPPLFAIEKRLVNSMNKFLDRQIRQKFNPYVLDSRTLRQIFNDLT